MKVRKKIYDNIPALDIALQHRITHAHLAGFDTIGIMIHLNESDLKNRAVFPIKITNEHGSNYTHYIIFQMKCSEGGTRCPNGKTTDNGKCHASLSTAATIIALEDIRLARKQYTQSH